MNSKPLYVDDKISRQIFELISKCGFPIPLIDKKSRKVINLCDVENIENRIIPNTVVIMAGGKGDRLMPLTNKLPNLCYL